MASELARDILQRQTEMEHLRSFYEPVWEAVSEFCAPDAPRTNWHGSRAHRYDNQASRTEERSKLIYDTTVISAVNRLTAGLESLITPQSEKWHGLSTAAMDDEETQEEAEWGEGLRDFLFSQRYQAGVNFVPAIQSCYRNVVRFGPAYLYPEQAFGSRHIMYSSLPVNEVYIARNRWGEVDTLHRKYEVTAKQAAEMFGDAKLPPKLREMANDTTKQLEKVEILHAIMPRGENGSARAGVARRFPVASYHILMDEEEIVRDSGFLSFPVACFNWGRDDGDDYGTSPCINALTTVKELNAVRMSGLRALQQITDPSTASKASLDYVPILNPSENYPGLMDDNGQMLISPIHTGANPTYAFDYAEKQAAVVQDMLFVNLFQVLVQNPEMTATEALIRQEEKGALLGPAGSVIQSGLASMVDRELAIYEEKGIYEPGSRFLPPESLAGKDIRVSFTSPLDVLRKAAEARDTLQIVSTAANFAQLDPTIMDNFDLDETVRVIQGAGRAPMRIFRRPEERDAIRQGRADAAKAQQGAAAMAQAAEAAQKGVPAAIQARDSGLLDGLAGMMSQGNA